MVRFLVLFLVFLIPLLAEEVPLHSFTWKVQKGDVIEFRKHSSQKILVNQSEINRDLVYKVLLEAVEKRENNKVLLEGDFHTLVLYPGDKAYREEETHHAHFLMNEQGIFEVPKKDFIPNVRSVPSFPKEAVKLEYGESWESPGEEVVFDDPRIYLDFPVRYQYRGNEKIVTAEGEKKLHRIISNYEISYENSEAKKDEPMRILGYSTTRWLWDEAEGIPYYASEEHNVVFSYPGGEVRDFKINSRSYYRKFRERPREEQREIIARLQEGLAEKGERSVSLDVEENEKGIRISLGELLFDYDSSKLNHGARNILKLLSGEIKGLDHVNVLVEGHTDSKGNDEYNEKLSLDRAQRVADFLLGETGMRAEEITYRGFGSSVPVATNETDEGRAKNRRVEVWILRK